MWSRPVRRSFLVLAAAAPWTTTTHRATGASNRADLTVPAGARVDWAGLYWANRYDYARWAGTAATRTPSGARWSPSGAGPYTLVSAGSVDGTKYGFQAYADITETLRGVSGLTVLTVAVPRRLALRRPAHGPDR